MTPADLTEDFEEEEYDEEDQRGTFVVYKETDIDEAIMLPDVDYVPGVISSEVDKLYG